MKQYDLTFVFYMIQKTTPSKTIKGMGILNTEGLQLMSSPLIEPEQISTKEFTEFDVLGVKITTPLDDNVVLRELRKSFGQDVVKHPNLPRRYVILNWRSHFNKKMI